MKRAGIIASILIMTSFAGCYRDKGNYEYHDINEIGISNVKASYSSRSGIDILQIEPKLTMTENGADSTRFNYYWIAMKDSKPVDTVGRKLNLNYPVTLPADTYILNFRVIDKVTNVVWKTKTTLTVGTPYSKGIMLMGEDANGNADVDMISMVIDTVVIKGLLAQSGLPALQGPINIVHSGGSASYIKLWAFTNSGSYTLDRLTMKGTSANIFGKQVYTTDNINKDQLKPILLAPQIRDSAGNVSSNFVRAMLTSDGNIFAAYLSLNGGDYYSNPVNRDKDDFTKLLKAAPYFMYPIANMGAMIWYDTENERFMNYSSFILNTSSVKLADVAGDIFPWNQAATGRKLVYAENTRNTDGGSTNGNSFAIMKDNNNVHYIYKFYVNAATPAKRNLYTIKPMATDFDKADFYAFSSRRSVVFYSVGNKLYAYDYNTGNEKFYQFPQTGTDPITMLKFDTQISYLTNTLYIATYNSTSKGTLKRYAVGTNPDVVDITPVDKASWSGLVKVKNMSWRAIN